MLAELKDRFYRMSFSSEIRLSLFKKIASFVGQGMPLLKTLGILEEEYRNINGFLDPRPYALKQWIDRMSNEAMTLHEAMSGWSTPNERMLIKSGEDSGSLSEAFENAIETTEATSNMASTVKSKLSHPALLLGILLLLVYLFSTEVVPVLIEVKDPQTWPDDAKALYTLSVFVENYLFHTLAAFALFIYAIAKVMGNATGPFRKYIDHLPPFSMYKSFLSSVFLVSLSSMMKSGVPIQNSIYEIRKLSNKYTKSQLTEIIDNFDKGLDVGPSFNTQFFDNETKVDIAVYSRASDIAENMQVIGKSSIANGVKTISQVADMIKLLVMLLIVFYIGWSYYGFFTLIKSISAM
jgi:type II secretory pathway component PulF